MALFSLVWWSLSILLVSLWRQVAGQGLIINNYHTFINTEYISRHLQ